MKNTLLITDMPAIPFEFVLDCLYPKSPVVKPMFGCHAVYIDAKIVFILRDKENFPEDNGVWIATTKDHHESLKKDFPSMRSIRVLGKGLTGWQVFPVTSDDFEESVVKACGFVLKADSRIGKIPKPRYRKKNKR